MKTIADQDHGRENNYHILRLIGALLVIVGHSYYLTASSGQEPLKQLTGYKHFGKVGEQMFFVISGYLVTKGKGCEQSSAECPSAACVLRKEQRCDRS